MRDSTKDRAVGRWRSLLPAFGVDARFLTGKHSGCPICSDGKDRFRFDDRAGHGTWICNKCGSGDGIALVMKLKGVQYPQACRMIDAELPSSHIEGSSAVKSASPNAMAERGKDMWGQAVRLDGTDAASLYLRRRGIEQPFPPMLRFQARMPYTHADKSKSKHPCMVARYVSPDASVSTFHLTYLDEAGRKADFTDPADKVRKFWPGKIPDGGAVRLAPSAETMGIAEGIETAMSAMQVFEVPVWAALNSGNLFKWQPPANVRCVLIFGDADEGFDGQTKAYALAHRLKLSGLNVEVRMPDFLGTDWNDYLQSLHPELEGA